MSIKIEMLRCFRTVADHGSLSEAAAILGRTPSAVSMMLKQFEEHIGAPLFETARKSRLTPLGELVLHEAGRGLSHFDRTLSAIEGLSRAERGHVRLAVTPSAAQVIMPPVLERFLRERPGVRIDLTDSDSATVQQDLLAERADIGLASLPPLPGLERDLILTDAFGLVCRADDPLIGNWPGHGWAALGETPFIANGLCKYISDPAFVPVLSAAPLMVRNTASILSLVRAGVGVTVLPELTVLPGSHDLAFLPLPGAGARRQLWMVTQPAHLMTPAALVLATAIRSAHPQAHRGPA
ncbi:DNA-binding transcriptional LysR family regulator [Roseovarius sp. MBR-154]